MALMLLLRDVVGEELQLKYQILLCAVLASDVRLCSLHYMQYVELARRSFSHVHSPNAQDGVRCLALHEGLESGSDNNRMILATGSWDAAIKV